VDELCELADAVLCVEGPVRNPPALSLAPEHRRGHGALYEAVIHGRIDIRRLRRSVAGLPLPRAADGRLMLAVDVSNWLRGTVALRLPWDSAGMIQMSGWVQMPSVRSSNAIRSL
jgi:DDE superfamily endonuclease